MTNKRPLYLVPPLPPLCPVCKDEDLPEPCPGCELIDGPDENVLTPFQKRLIGRYTKAEVNLPGNLRYIVLLSAEQLSSV